MAAAAKDDDIDDDIDIDMRTMLPTAANSLHVLDRMIRQQDRANISNYLRSIHQDAAFVADLRGLYAAFPLFANLRNGLWYAPRFDGTAYFKSGDGHPPHWRFSTLRLNAHVLTAAAKAGGLILVDSTRRGKSFPDSFTRTVPIWCAVVNRVLGFAGPSTWPAWMSKSEADQIETLIPTWIAELGSAEQVLRDAGKGLRKPLQPVWLCPQVNEDAEDFDALPPWLEDVEFTPMVLISASKFVASDAHREMHSWTYVQGAGDDEENWARGLTPALFWAHAEELVAMHPAACATKVAELVAAAAAASAAPSDSKCVEDKSLLLPGLAIRFCPAASLPLVDTASFHTIIEACAQVCVKSSTPTPVRLECNLTKGDKAVWSKSLIPRVVKAAAHWAAARAADTTAGPCLIVYDDEEWVAAAVGTMMVAAYWDVDASCWTPTPRKPTKDSIRQAFAVIAAACTPAPNVPRWMFKELNKYFLPGA